MGRMAWLAGVVVVCAGMLHSAGLAQPTLTPQQLERNVELGVLGQFVQDNTRTIVVGEILDVPVKQEKALPWQQPGTGQVSVYSCQIKVMETLHGLESSKEMKVYLTRWPDKTSPNPAGVRKGDKCIFVLSWLYGGPENSHKITLDPWLGVQPYNAKLVELLRKHGNRPGVR